MRPILFQLGSFTAYSYGFLIGLGAVASAVYVAVQGRRVAGLERSKVIDLFVCLFFAGFVGGKALLFFEDPSYYTANPGMLLEERGFVFYGSFLLGVPTMLWFFKRNGLPVRRMLDVMAVATCLVQIFGRVGCFLAGCCHGKPTTSALGVSYVHSDCYAPLGQPLHAVQLYEAGFVLLVLFALLALRDRISFHGQLFLSYVVAYASGRLVLESFRGDAERGLLFDGLLSHSQLIAIALLVVAGVTWTRWSRSERRLSTALQ